LVPGPSHLDVKITVAKLKKYKSPDSDQIPAELIQAGGEMLLSAIYKLINYIWNKGELPDQWMESIIVPIHKKGDKTDCNNYRGISLLRTSYKILSNVLSRLSPYVDEIIAIINADSDVTDQLLIRFSAFVRYWRKKWEYNETVHQLFIDFKKACDSVRREVLYNILTEFGVPMKLVRLITMCLNETYSKVLTGKHLSISFPIQNGLKEGDALSSLLFNFALEYAIRKVQEKQVELKLNRRHQLLAYFDDVRHINFISC
jgi:hypothetical protein